MKIKQWYSLLAIILLFSCKKENTEILYPQYQVGFKIHQTINPLSIAYVNSTGTVDAMIVPVQGINVVYGNVTSNQQLFVTAAKQKGDTGYVKISWEIKEVPFYKDSFWFNDTTLFHTFVWQVPK